MAEKKIANVSFRTASALKEEFEGAFALSDFPSTTGYFEDCMRALIISVREGKKIRPPLQFVTSTLSTKPRKK